ncbi:DUF5958 family protein [Streptomyces sp. NPDC001876]|uniref:DUF5958 family protein n=1 Tax=Streptomyces sp. NPDC001876 TaxID=3154402 RepID=UPI003330E883
MHRQGGPRGSPNAGGRLGKIAGPNLSTNATKAFRLLVAVLAIADEQRRQRFCSGGCGHRWNSLPVAR